MRQNKTFFTIAQTFNDPLQQCCGTGTGKRNRNFLPCGTGTGTVTNYGSGNVKNGITKNLTKTQSKIVYMISFV